MFLLDSIAKDIYLKNLNVETAIVDGNFPASTTYIDVSDFEKFGFLVLVGGLTSALTLQVKQDTSATQTAGIKDVTGATDIVGATDDNGWAAIEVQADRLDSNNDFRYVTLAISGAAGGDDYAAILFYGIPGIKPPTQPALAAGGPIAGAPIVIAG